MLDGRVMSTGKLYLDDEGEVADDLRHNEMAYSVKHHRTSRVEDEHSDKFLAVYYVTIEVNSTVANSGVLPDLSVSQGRQDFASEYVSEMFEMETDLDIVGSMFVERKSKANGKSVEFAMKYEIVEEAKVDDDYMQHPGFQREIDAMPGGGEEDRKPVAAVSEETDEESPLVECPVDGCSREVMEGEVREHCLDEHGFWDEQYEEVIENGA